MSNSPRHNYANSSFTDIGADIFFEFDTSVCEVYNCVTKANTRPQEACQTRLCDNRYWKAIHGITNETSQKCFKSDSDGITNVNFTFDDTCYKMCCKIPDNICPVIGYYKPVWEYVDADRSRRGPQEEGIRSGGTSTRIKCRYPKKIFNNARAISDAQKFLGSGATSDAIFNKTLLPLACGQPAADPCLCPNDPITNVKMTKCSNMTVKDGEGNLGDICREWIQRMEDVDGGKFILNDTMNQYCDNYNSEATNDCQCIERSQNDDYKTLRGSGPFTVPFADRCWYVPCLTTLSSKILNPPEIQDQVCPKLVCNNVIFNFVENGGIINMKNVNQVTSCFTDNDLDPANLSGDLPTPKNFGDKVPNGKKPFPYVTIFIVAAVIVAVIIIIIILTKSGKKGSKK